MGPLEKCSLVRFGLYDILVFWMGKILAFGRVGGFGRVKECGT